jgi:TonB family protein
VPNPKNDPDVHLQRLAAPQNLDLPWYRSLYRNLRELIHPPRLPPLELTSQPVEVKDIWGLYGRQKKSFLMSTAFQAVVAGLVVLVGLSDSNVPGKVKDIIRRVYLDPPPAELPRIPPSDKTGGGGGGDGSILPPSRGRLAPAKPREFAAPVAVYHNLNPQIAMDPSIVSAVAISTDSNLKNYGDPWAPNGALSNGPGYGGGVGNKCCGGQGPGDGNGSGPGPGGRGAGDQVFVAGGSGLTNPVVLYKPEPDYSDEARKAKLQGTVLLEVVVDQNGRPQVRKVLQSLGLGLDDQAIKAVSIWRFRAGMKGGKPVDVLVNVSVSFRLL